MHFRYTTALVGLFALSQTLWNTHATAIAPRQSIDDLGLVRHAKRFLDMSTILVRDEDNLEKTWSGWVDQPVDAQEVWTKKEFGLLTLAAHKHIASPGQEPYILGALWIPGQGIAFGSQIRGRGSDKTTVQRTFEQLISNGAPVLFEKVRDRTVVQGGTSPKYHAEDVAMWKAAKELSRKNRPITGSTYPPGALMATYGSYHLDKGPIFVKPCRSAGETAWSQLSPGCKSVLQSLNIERWLPDESLLSQYLASQTQGTTTSS
jgi:hypothetical protein